MGDGFTSREITDRSSPQDSRLLAQSTNLSQHAQDSFQPRSWQTTRHEQLSGGFLDTSVNGLYGGECPILAQAEVSRQNGYISNAPDLDSIDPSKLSLDAQFGGAAGNWFRYLGREGWHTLAGMSQPGAADDMIFGSYVSAKHYYTENNPQTVLNDISQLGRDAQRALWHIPEMTPAARSKASAEMVFNAFFLVGARTPMAAETVEQMGLKAMSSQRLAALGIERDVAMMYNGERMNLNGVEVTKATGDELNSIWLKGWSVRGFEGETQMGISGVLAQNFPRIDDAMFKDGVFTSMKTVDLNAKTYQDMEKLEKRLESCLDKLQTWQGQWKEWAGVAINPSQVQEKVLQIGIPNGSMTPEQAAVFEKLGQKAQAKGIELKVTTIE